MFAECGLKISTEEKEQMLKSCFSLLKARKEQTVKSPGFPVSGAQPFGTGIRFQRRINFLKIAFLNDHRRPRHPFVDDSVFVLLRFFEISVSYF